MDIQANFSGLISDLSRLQNDFPDAEEDGLEAVAEMGLEEKREQVEKTYRMPEPPGGHRSGAWRDNQEIEREPGERRIVTTGPASEPITNYPGGYEEKLQDLPDGADGVNRSNPAAENAHPVIEERAPDVFEERFARRLGL